MKTLPEMASKHHKLLLIYFILIQSTLYANASTPKPKFGDVTFETLPQPTTATGNIGATENGTTTPPIRVDPEQGDGLDLDDDLDSLATSSDTSTSRNGSKKSNLVEEQVVAPSVTTVHQVWASSSSHNLNELSPEVIAKLRNDVPFLAAYSIRPRLVGISSVASPDNQVGAPPYVSGPIPASYTGQELQAPTAAASEISATPGVKPNNGAARLSSSQSGLASSPQGSALSKLGNFNEFNVETSSTSRSEHHHKRKTVLKRKAEDLEQPAELRSKKRRVSNTVGELAARRGKHTKSKQHGNRRRTRQRSSKGLQRSGRLLKRSKSATQRNHPKTNRLRLKTNGRSRQHHKSIIKYGRYVQDQQAKTTPVEASNGTSLVDSVEGSSKDDSGRKGGSTSRGDKRVPFYSKVKPSTKVDDNKGGDYEQPDNRLDDGAPMPGGTGEATKPTSSRDEIGETGDEGLEADEGGSTASLPEPRRVGDDDVEEDGDTVMVEPKFDGVDDDPEPSADDEAPGSSEKEEPSAERKESPSEDRRLEGEGNIDEQEGPRARRVNRERPNQADSNKAMNGEDGSALGGGIGATIGNSGTSNPDYANSEPVLPDKSDYDGDQMQDDIARRKPVEDGDGQEFRETNTTRINSSRADGKSTIDEGLDDDAEMLGPDDRDSDMKRIGSIGGKSDEADSDKRDNSGEGDGRKRMEAGGGDDNTEATMGGEGEEPDVDYRDEIAAEAGRRKKPQASDGKSSKRVDPSGQVGEHCDNQSHSSHHYDHDQEHHHHDHHDTIKWLQDAVPGEPGVDYPILSKVNLTNFNCRDQKYPGYYADVSSRCQIFHICQADGRQDSFLCPNGTIFSQISSVCVWWNSFDCEDAPKYYKLNELLYKSRPRTSASANDDDDDDNTAPGSAGSPIPATNLRPLDGVSAPLAGSHRRANVGGADQDDESSPIDGLIRDMQPRRNAIGRHDAGDKTGVTYEAESERAKGGRGAMMDRAIGAYDETSAQRKATDSIDEDSSGLDEASARLRNHGRPRRKRRASAKQSPRKLKPGRYVRRRPVGKTINKIRGPASKQKRRA